MTAANFTQDDLALLESMLANGSTFREITAAFNANGLRFSQGAVSRRAKKLNLKSRNRPAVAAEPIPPNPHPPKTVLSHPWQGKANTDAHEKARETSLANVAERSESDAAKVASGVSIIDIDANQCRWPLSENVRPILDFRYCGEPTCDEKCSYCRHHFMRSMRGRGEAAE